MGGKGKEQRKEGKGRKGMGMKGRGRKERGEGRERKGGEGLAYSRRLEPRKTLGRLCNKHIHRHD